MEFPPCAAFFSDFHFHTKLAPAPPGPTSFVDLLRSACRTGFPGAVFGFCRIFRVLLCRIHGSILGVLSRLLSCRCLLGGLLLDLLHRIGLDYPRILRQRRGVRTGEILDICLLYTSDAADE